MKTFLLWGVLAIAGLAVQGDSGRIFSKTEEGLIVKPEPQEETEDTEGTFQSDMLLTPEQKAELMKLIEEGEQDGELGKRRVTAFQYKRWPKNTLMYDFHPSSVPDRTEILKGLELWTKYTCVNIVPYSSSMAASLGHHNRILFFKGSGCSSYVGMSGRGAQNLNIGPNCAHPGTVAHEVGHALGWHHEQSRPDRDEYVTINHNNIKDGAEINFAKYTASQIATHEVPYDVESIMHYGSAYFSKNGRPTIEARNPFDEFLMGNRADFSFNDRKLANLMFDCAKDCTNNLQCLNEGFVDKNCKCVCKPGYSGNRCQDYDPRKAGCTQRLTERTGTLTSPNYPDNYRNGQTCVWLIEAGEGATITLKFKQFDVETDSYCNYDKVTVRFGSNMNSGGNSYCGNRNPSDITSVGNRMLVAFTSDFSRGGSGFEAEYTIHGNTIEPSASTPEPKTHLSTPPPVKELNCEKPAGSCGGTFAGSGCIASPNYGEGGKYDNRQDCLYNIQVAKGQRVELNLLSLDVEEGSNCAWDRLEVDLGGGSIGILKLCGHDRPRGSFVSMSNYMTLRLISDDSINGKGFAAKFETVRLDH